MSRIKEQIESWQEYDQWVDMQMHVFIAELEEEQRKKEEDES